MANCEGDYQWKQEIERMHIVNKKKIRIPHANKTYKLFLLKS